QGNVGELDEYRRICVEVTRVFQEHARRQILDIDHGRMSSVPHLAERSTEHTVWAYGIRDDLHVTVTLGRCQYQVQQLLVHGGCVSHLCPKGLLVHEECEAGRMAAVQQALSFQTCLNLQFDILLGH